MSLFAPGVFVFFIVEAGDLGPTAGLAGLPGSLIVRLPKWQCGRCERDLKRLLVFGKLFIQ
jgi:hypothetical protein